MKDEENITREFDRVSNSIKIKRHKNDFRKAFIWALSVFVAGLTIYWLIGLYGLVFYIFCIVSLVFGAAKYFEYHLPISINTINAAQKKMRREFDGYIEFHGSYENFKNSVQRDLINDLKNKIDLHFEMGESERKRLKKGLNDSFPIKTKD